MTYTIYIVEDERKIADSIAAYLEKYGYRAVIAEDFSDVYAEFLELQPHLVILDIQLPYQDGYHLCRQIRQSSNVPILILSSRASEMDQIYGLETGADDYITKPFQLDLLFVKVKALLRRVYGDYRPGEEPSERIAIGALQLDLGRMEISYEGDSQALTKNEGRLLYLLMKRKGKVVLREECLEALWEDMQFVEDNTLTVNVTRVRKKLAVWKLEQCIETVRGMGYRFNSKQLEESS